MRRSLDNKHFLRRYRLSQPMFDLSQIINGEMSEDNDEDGNPLVVEQVKKDRSEESIIGLFGCFRKSRETIKTSVFGIHDAYKTNYIQFSSTLSTLENYREVHPPIRDELIQTMLIEGRCRTIASLMILERFIYFREEYLDPLNYLLEQESFLETEFIENLVAEDTYDQCSFSANYYRRTYYFIKRMKQLVRDIILYHLPTSTHSLKTMVSTLAAQSSLLDHRKRKKIEDFCLKYQSLSALGYYTEDSFFYRVINSTLRQQRYDIIYQYRHAIIDISECLRRPSPSEDDGVSMVLYRGQQMSIFELEMLKNNVGELVSCSSFFSTSFNKDLAKIYSGDGSHDDPCLASAIFTIHLDTGQPIRPYAWINNSAEDEVLFSPGTKFILMSCRKLHDNGRLWLLDLKAVSEEQHEQHKITYGETFLLLSSASGWPVSVVVVHLIIT